MDGGNHIVLCRDLTDTLTDVCVVCCVAGQSQTFMCYWEQLRSSKS